jgi:hypothetical protein
MRHLVVAGWSEDRELLSHARTTNRYIYVCVIQQTLSEKQKADELSSYKPNCNALFMRKGSLKRQSGT